MEKSFSSKIGVLLAAAGSAVGLGSIWKFPYVAGEDGGGAFIILYIVCSLVFGVPLVMNEFLIESHAPQMILYAVIAIVLTASVLWFDVNKGIERLSKILMPLLFVILILLAIHMIFIDGGSTGLRYLFEPDFSKITSKVFLEAMGLSFFTFVRRRRLPRYLWRLHAQRSERYIHVGTNDSSCPHCVIAGWHDCLSGHFTLARTHCHRYYFPRLHQYNLMAVTYFPPQQTNDDA